MNWTCKHRSLAGVEISRLVYFWSASVSSERKRAGFSSFFLSHFSNLIVVNMNVRVFNIPFSKQVII